MEDMDGWRLVCFFFVGGSKPQVMGPICWRSIRRGWLEVRLLRRRKSATRSGPQFGTLKGVGNNSSGLVCSPTVVSAQQRIRIGSFDFRN